MSEAITRPMFLRLAVFVEGGLIGISLVLAWVLEIPLGDWLSWDREPVLWGVGSSLLLSVVLGGAYFRPVGSYRGVKDFLLEAIGPAVAKCRWYELLLVAALAGIGEELLFRGVIQPAMEGWGVTAALILSNVLFGICHAMSATYAVLAFGIGVFFGWLLAASGQRRLTPPILAHGLYDFFALCLVSYDWRRLREGEAALSDLEEREEFPEAEENGGHR